MNLTINPINLYKSFNKISFKGDMTIKSIDTSMFKKRPLEDEFSYQDEEKQYEEESYLKYLTSPRVKCYTKPLLEELVDMCNWEDIGYIYMQLEKNPKDKIPILLFVLNSISKKLTHYVNSSEINRLDNILLLTLHMLKGKEKSLLDDTTDKIGNSILANATYKRNDTILNTILCQLNDECIVPILLEKNMYDEYLFGNTDDIIKGKPRITKIDPYTKDETKKVNIPKKSIEKIRERVLHILDNENIDDKVKMRLLYIYMPRKRNEYLYSEYQDKLNI